MIMIFVMFFISEHPALWDFYKVNNLISLKFLVSQQILQIGSVILE